MSGSALHVGVAELGGVARVQRDVRGRSGGARAGVQRRGLRGREFGGADLQSAGVCGVERVVSVDGLLGDVRNSGCESSSASLLGAGRVCGTADGDSQLRSGTVPDLGAVAAVGTVQFGVRRGRSSAESRVQRGRTM